MIVYLIYNIIEGNHYFFSTENEAEVALSKMECSSELEIERIHIARKTDLLRWLNQLGSVTH